MCQALSKQSYEIDSIILTLAMMKMNFNKVK